MLKALYDYGVRQNLTQPPGFSGKTVKAYISLSEDDDHVSIYLGDKESVLCPDIGSLAQGRDKCNILVEKQRMANCQPRVGFFWKHSAVHRRQSRG